MTFTKPLIIGLAVFILSSCALTKDVQRIVDESNAAVLTDQLEDGKKSAEQIRAFIEDNPDLKGVNQRLLVRLGAVYLDANKPVLARAALDEAHDMAGLNQLGERDQMLVALRGPLIWRYSLNNGVSKSERASAKKNVQDMRDYRNRNLKSNGQLQAWLLREEVTAARKVSLGFPLEQTTKTVVQHRELVQATLNAYGKFWGETKRLNDVQNLRSAAAQSCVNTSEEIKLDKLSVDQLHHFSLYDYSSSMYCEVENLLESYNRMFSAYAFVDADDPAGAQDRSTVKQPLETPSWMTCTPKSDKSFACSPNLTKAE